MQQIISFEVMSKFANIRNSLIDINRNVKTLSPEQVEKQVISESQKLHHASIQYDASQRHPSYEQIPRFYYCVAETQQSDNDESSPQRTLHSIFTSFSQSSLVEHMSDMAITRQQFESIVDEIEQRTQRRIGSATSDVLIDYTIFSSCIQHLSVNQRHLFGVSPKLFGTLAMLDVDNVDAPVELMSNDNYVVSHISALRFLFHLLHENQIHNLLVALQCYCLNLNSTDETMPSATSASKLPNRISENDLMNFIYDSLNDIEAAKVLNSNFHPYYVFTVVRKIIFFLDPSHRGSCDVYQLARSSFCNEFVAMKAARSIFNDVDHQSIESSRICSVLMQMQDTLTIAASRASRIGLTLIGSAPLSLMYTSVTDPGKLPPQFSTSNDKLSWFHPVNAQQLYNLYMELDIDGNGMLTKDELTRIRKGGLNPMFIDVLFASIMLYHNPANDQYEMDYKGYLDLMLALEYSHTEPAVQWLFTLLDVRKRGYLDHGALCYWFKPIRDKLLSLRADANVVSCDVMANELIDMAGASLTEKITLDMLIESGVGHTVLMCLIDCVYFHQYDNRESLQQQQ